MGEEGGGGQASVRTAAALVQEGSSTGAAVAGNKRVSFVFEGRWALRPKLGMPQGLG